MNVRTVDLASVDVGGRLRALDPAWVSLLAEEIHKDGLTSPIRVLERGSRYQLIDGALRVAACLQLGMADIQAVIEPEWVLADDAAVRLGEIKGNMVRSELTVSERARYLASWREVHESVHGLPKRGRKAAAEKSAKVALNSGAANDDAEDPFLLSFTEAAKKALGISRRSLFLALKIATIDPVQSHRLTGHPSADNQTELLILAEQPAERQVAIVDLLMASEPTAATVAEAIVLLDGAPTPPRATPVERFHQTFARLRPQERHAVYDLNAEDIERWMASRGAGRRASGRGAA